MLIMENLEEASLKVFEAIFGGGKSVEINCKSNQLV